MKWVLSMPDFKKLWDKSGEAYVQYAGDSSQYHETSKIITQLAKLKSGQIVLDLGCGTGITTLAILSRLREQGKVYCVDASQGMLAQAKKAIGSPLCEFITAPAEEFAAHITQGNADRVICNAAFWQFTDKVCALRQIRSVLKPDGHFIFSLPQQFYDMPGTGNHTDIVQAIFEELELHGYRHERKLAKPFNKEILQELLVQGGFRLGAVRLQEFPGSTLEDGIAFFRIPAIAPFFEDVPDNVRESVLQAVDSKLRSAYDSPPNRWAFITAKPVPSE